MSNVIRFHNEGEPKTSAHGGYGAGEPIDLGEFREKHKNTKEEKELPEGVYLTNEQRGEILLAFLTVADLLPDSKIDSLKDIDKVGDEIVKQIFAGPMDIDRKEMLCKSYKTATLKAYALTGDVYKKISDMSCNKG